MELFITDLTEMGGGNYCVAGWDSANSRMVRPLPNGTNWSSGNIEKFSVQPGAVINFTLANVAHGAAYPHATEDTRVIQAQNLGIEQVRWTGGQAPHLAATVQEAFQNNIEWNSQFQGRRQGVHVAVGANSRSLWGLRIDAGGLRFVEEFGKLKAVIDDGDSEYICAVSGAALKTRYRAGGIAALNGELPANAVLHARLGLARAFGSSPDKCYMMLNGLHF